MGSEPILGVCICITIDDMLNFDDEFDANADVTCEQGFKCYKCHQILQTT